MTKFNVSNFVSAMNTTLNGIGRRTNFRMSFTLPPSLSQYSSLLPIVTVSSNVPPIGTNSIPIRRGTTNYEENFPYNIVFGDLSCTFLSDGKGQVLKMLNDWITTIYPVEGADRFRVAYRSDYVAPVATLEHFDTQGNLIVTYEFRDVYPERVSDLSFSWGAFDDIVQIPVEFKYSYYKIKRPETQPSTQTDAPQQPAQRTGYSVRPDQGN